jgi:hypothetical protein
LDSRLQYREIFLYYPGLSVTDIIIGGSFPWNNIEKSKKYFIEKFNNYFKESLYVFNSLALKQGDGVATNGTVEDESEEDGSYPDTDNLTSSIDLMTTTINTIIQTTPTVSYGADWLLPSTNIVVEPSAST